MVPPKIEYTFSAFGKTLELVITAMATWGETYEQEIRSCLELHDPAPSQVLPEELS